MVITVTCLSKRKKTSLKQLIKIFTSPFCLGSISNKFEAEEVSLKRYVYGFSVDCNAVDKSDALNIHKYLMIKNK